MNIEKMLEMQTQVDAKIMEKVEIDKPLLLILLNLAKNTLHFTEEEIEEAYMAKAKINMERQEEGY
ncbi:dUTP diphosphatase [Listeria booriae]|uniref:dUTP diphosphatase n=1 Tax=Listeria booriae TaxID=1552123 RepID=UPI001628A54A|nr:dUTP diphosphatase [Listeria booriae]MBC1233655.1 hypothetical protein [Listeria booriae]